MSPEEIALRIIEALIKAGFVGESVGFLSTVSAAYREVYKEINAILGGK
jgi:hypothetical protein